MSDADLIKAQADARRAEIEGSWPKKWGSFVIPAFATICVAIVSFTGTQLAAINADKEKAIENNREALKIYFEHFAQMSTCDEQAARQVSLIQAITSSSGLQIALQKIIDCVSAQNAQNASANSQVAIAQGLPTAVDTAVATTLASYTAYIQYPAGKEGEADALGKALKALGLRVPGTQRVKHAPDANSVRFYSEADQTSFAGQLSKVGDLKFAPTTLRQANLPQGIVEFWIGAN